MLLPKGRQCNQGHSRSRLLSATSSNDSSYAIDISNLCHAYGERQVYVIGSPFPAQGCGLHAQHSSTAEICDYIKVDVPKMEQLQRSLVGSSA